ncbi:cadherin domain-containing protein, partial [Opitutales bacterium]|nr:cadherin domain-containing protein [Opitutales bacterium]
HNATVEGNFTVTLTDVFDNQAPGAISIQFASLTENQAIGTVVGKLNAVDPEAGVVRYSLVNGSGAMGNQFFTVDPTGVLRTAVVFDFEQNASHSIRGRAMDEFNASREEVLNIQVSNQWEDPDGDGLENSYDPDDDNDGFSDIAEIAYGSDPLDPNSLPNRAPSEIYLSSDRVEENMPIGTMVGQLRTIDGDDPNGTGVYQYSFITHTGAEFFSLDSNGTMLTKRELDFESNSSHTVGLRVTDHLGAYLDQNLTIQVVDAFIPIVETDDPVNVGFQEAMLSGKLLDKGSSMDLIQIGMLVSTDPNPNLNTKGGIRERGFLDTNQTFEVMMMGLEKGTKYFYRTFAMNAEGVGYGVVKDFVMQEHASGPSWANAQAGAAANWWTSPWFGSFYMNDGNAWVMHSELGWLYPMASGDKGAWLWVEQLGWLWTDEAFYPFLYQNSSAGWFYFYGASQGKKLFYHYRDERWMQMDSGEQSD